jgi:hypothetical protein
LNTARLSHGIYRRTAMKGREASMIFNMGWSKRRLETKRLIPTERVKARSEDWQGS